MIRRSLPGFLVITIQSQLLSKQEASSQENWLPSILPPRKSDYTTRAEDYPTLDCYLAKPRNTSRETRSRLIETDILSSPDTADPRPETRTTLTLMASFLVIPAFDIRYNLDRTVSQDSSYWRVTNNSYISANVGGSSMRLLSRMNDVLGRFRLEFNYAANTSSVSEARGYDNALLVGRAVPSPENPAHLRIAFGTSDNAFIVSKAARNAGQLYQLFTTLSETNVVPKMRLMRDIVIDDMASRGIARESAEQRVLFGFDGVTLSPKYMINQTRFANNNNVYILTDINGASKQNYRIETRGRVVGQTIVQYVMITRPDGSTRNLDLTRDQLGAPTVSSVSAMTVYVNETSAPITATITDNDTPPERIRMTAIVNPNIVPRANVVVSGTGLTRTITVRPINTGTVNMFIQVNDGENTAASQTVNLTIRPQ